MRIGQKCAGCDRVMRPAHTLKEDWPGTIAHYGRGMCAPCARAKKLGREVGPPKQKRPAVCTECDRPMRQRNTSRVTGPRTVQHGSGGLCASCYAAARAGRGPVTPRPVRKVRPCRGCERPTRPGTVPLADKPGTVPRVRNGFCKRCICRGVEAEVLGALANAGAWRTRLVGAA